LVEEVWQLLSNTPAESVSQSNLDDDELMDLSEHALKGLVATHSEICSFYSEFPVYHIG
jgi:hypothetical protein